jgi:hypothetical protein
VVLAEIRRSNEPSNERARTRVTRPSRQSVRKDAIEHASVIYPPNAARLVRQHRLDRGPFMIVEFVAHDSRLRFRSLNRVHGDPINPKWPVALSLVPLIYFRRRNGGHGPAYHGVGPGRE